jgi:hypothetical protein
MTVHPMRQAFHRHHLAHEFAFNREPVSKWLAEWKNFDPTM